MRYLKTFVIGSFLGLYLCSGTAYAQQTVFSRAESSTGNWWDVSNPWKRLCDDWFLDRPDKNTCFNWPNLGRNDLFIGHNANNPMTVNGAWFQVRNLTIQPEVTISRTYNSSSGGISLNGGIYNSSAQQQNFNVPIGVDGTVVQFEAINGGYSFSQDFFINANTAEFLGAFNTTVSGLMSGANGKVTKNGTGTLTITNASNSYTGATTINAGTLVLNPSANTNINTPVVLNGGSLSTTAIASGRVITNANTLALNASSTISLGATNHELRFANSSAATWTGAASLVVSGWTGTAGFSGTGGKVFFGSDATGLTSAQLAQISFTGYPNPAMILPTGEIVPNPSGLPVELTYFNVSCNANNQSVIAWSTASELNASHFVVHRSTDGLTWEKITHIPAHGTTNNENQYSFVDLSTPRSELHFYKLEQVDFNGDSKIYPAISSTCFGNNVGFVIFPNPSTDLLNLTFDWKEISDNFNVKIFDNAGRLVSTQHFSPKIGNNLIQLSVEHLVTGSYFISLSTSESILDNQRFVKR